MRDAPTTVQRATIVGFERMGANSASGNPRYRLHLKEAGSIDTAPDAAVNYGLNSDVLNVELTIVKRDGKAIRLVLDGEGDA